MMGLESALMGLAENLPKKGVAETSKCAYKEISDSGELNRQCLIIWKLLEGYPEQSFTAREIQRKLFNKGIDLDINAISGRLNDMWNTYYRGTLTRIIKRGLPRKCTVKNRLAIPHGLPHLVRYGEQIEAQL